MGSRSYYILIIPYYDLGLEYKSIICLGWMVMVKVNGNAWCAVSCAAPTTTSPTTGSTTSTGGRHFFILCFLRGIHTRVSKLVWLISVHGVLLRFFMWENTFSIDSKSLEISNFGCWSKCRLGWCGAKERQESRIWYLICHFF